MQAMKEGKVVFEGDLKACWKYLEPYMVVGKKLVGTVETASVTANVLPGEYTVHAKEGEY